MADDNTWAEEWDGEPAFRKYGDGYDDSPGGADPDGRIDGGHGGHDGHGAETSSLQCWGKDATETQGKKRAQKKEWRVWIAFLLFGFINNFGYCVMLTGASKILDKRASVGVLVICTILPSLIIKLVGPWFIHRVPYTVRIVMLMLLQCSAFVLVAAFGKQYLMLALLGVSIISLASGIGEPTFLGLTSFYSERSVSMWSTGTGFAGVGGAGLYILFTSDWGFHLTPENTLYALSWFPLLFCINYFFVLPPPVQHKDASGPSERWSQEKLRGINGVRISATEAEIHREARTSLLQPGEGDDKCEPGASQVEGFARNRSSGAKADLKSAKLSVRERIDVLIALKIIMIPLTIVYFAEYTILAGVSAAQLFQGKMPRPQDQYSWYNFTYQVAVLISRSSVNIFHTRKVWIFSAIQACLLVGLFLLAYYDEIPSRGGFYIVAMLSFLAGLLGGACYVQGFYTIRTDFPEFTKEFALTAGSVSGDVGILISGIVSVYVQDELCCRYQYHCMDDNNTPLYTCGSLWG